MGESIHCNMEVRTPSTWSNDVDKRPWFVTMYYDDLFEWPDIQAHIVDNEIHGWIMSGALNYGSNSEQAAAAMAAMRELGVPFIFCEEGHPEWSGSLEIFTGTRSIERTITEDSSTVLDKNDWLRLRGQYVVSTEHDIINTSALVGAIDAWWKEAEINLDDLTVDHLPVFCPPNPDDRLDNHINALIRATAGIIDATVLYGRPPA